MDAPCLSVPVRSGITEATAVVLLGPHETGNDIDADEREMLDRLAERAATSYERVVTGMLRQEAVSYTHLDVYKRQPSSRAPALYQKPWSFDPFQLR